jgi:hypothetical protein
VAARVDPHERPRVPVPLPLVDELPIAA